MNSEDYPVAGNPAPPRSAIYDDIYHSADGGPQQARHVFLGGNRLPARWRGARDFSVLETGFGLGLNFLVTWAAWREDEQRSQRLHFVSIEKHPFTADKLAQLHTAYPEFAALSAELRGAWPLLANGLHRLAFDRGRVVLTLALGDIAGMLPRLRMAADAIYLDGFSPAKNPDMWSQAVCKGISRLAAPGATLATWSAAAAVRDGLAAAGFEVGKAPGFGHKREMSIARFAPRWKVRRREPELPRVWSERRAAVIGAGLAGAAVCEVLVSRGWSVELIERHAGPCEESSGNHAGAFHPLLARDESVLARLSRAGFLHALRAWRALEAAGHRFDWARCGLLLLDREVPDSVGGGIARTVNRDEAAALAGVALTEGGAFFPDAGWVRPGSLVRAQLARCAGAAFRVHYGREAAQLERSGATWIMRDAAGGTIATAPVVILANAGGAATLLPQARIEIRRVRGQLSHLPAASFAAPRCVVCRDGYLLPAIDGIALTGATYDLEDEDDARVRAGSHAANLQRLRRIIADVPHLDPAALDGRVAWRAVAADRLPMLGALPDAATAFAGRARYTGAHLADLPRLPGLYGAFAYASRGLTWAALGAEFLADIIEGVPQALEADLADAIDPARFVLRDLRREPRSKRQNVQAPGPSP